MLSVTCRDGKDVDDYVLIGDDIKVMFRKVGTQYRVTIDAPRHIPILRKAVIEKRAKAAAEAELQANP